MMTCFTGWVLFFCSSLASFLTIRCTAKEMKRKGKRDGERERMRGQEISEGGKLEKGDIHNKQRKKKKRRGRWVRTNWMSVQKWQDRNWGTGRDVWRKREEREENEGRKSAREDIITFCSEITSSRSNHHLLSERHHPLCNAHENTHTLIRPVILCIHSSRSGLMIPLLIVG